MNCDYLICLGNRSRSAREYWLYLKNEREYFPSSLKIAASGICFYTHTVPRD